MKKILILLIPLICFISCDKNEYLLPNNGYVLISNSLQSSEVITTDTIFIENGQLEPTIENGFYGFVIEWIGDFMPGDTPSTGIVDSVQKEIYIYKKLTYNDIKNARTDDFNWFWNVDNFLYTPIAIVRSNDLGFYEIELDSGDYSGFVKIDDYRFYSNGSTSDDQFGAMNISSRLLEKRDFHIDYEKND